MLCYSHELAYRYLTFDDLILSFLGGDIRDEGEVCYM